MLYFVERKRSYEPQRTEKSMCRCNCGFCHRGCSGDAGGVSQPGSDPAVLWQAHLRLYKGPSGSCQRLFASRLLHGQHPDDAGDRGMPDRMQKNGSGAAGGRIAFMVFKHRPAPDSLHRKSTRPASICPRARPGTKAVFSATAALPRCA